MTKQTLVLLPGLLCDERLWHHQVDYFKDLFEIIIPDFSACDLLEDMARSVIDQVQGEFYLAGLSMGGYVALEIMVHFPDRVKKLALLNTSARADDVKMNRRRRALIAQVKGLGTFRGVTNKLLKLLIDHSQLENETLISLVKRMTVEVGKDVYLRHQNAILHRKSHLDILKKIMVPTLCIGGRTDQIISYQETVEMAKNLPQNEAYILDHCGHLSSLEAPDKINQYFEKFFVE